MNPSVHIDSRTTSAATTVPAVMTTMMLDIGREAQIATAELPISDASYVPELEWCRRELSALLPRLRDREASALAMIRREDGVTMETVIAEIERALATPDGISARFRGWSR